MEMGKICGSLSDINCKTNKRFVLIDNLYTYGMILVVFGHVRLTAADETTYLYHWIYGFHMALFFWIAGFLLNLPVTNPPFCLQLVAFKKFLIKKIKRLIIPLIVLSTIAYLIIALFSWMSTQTQTISIEDYLFSMLFPEKNPIGFMWFLYALFWVYILGELCIKICHNKPIYWLIAAISTAILFRLTPTFNLLCLHGSLYWFGYFCLGRITRLKIGSLLTIAIKHDIEKYSMAIFLIMTILYSILVIYLNNNYILAITGLLSAISFMFFLQRINVDFFPQLRPYTFTIYLLQWFAFILVRNVCFKILHWNIIFCYLLMFLVGLFFPVLIGVIANKYISHKSIGKFILLAIGL